ncbi:globin-coupled sensor protein [Sphingosinithalassobacter sp. CS137]|uniref:globin-coupled sensor protein n=1 Tax=Sphingosinithalassobacter sp. CS137 TaxID=2762748 RepID=UPI00165E2C85|nr:globin-coupled sensor protein [Sphingosinithalassobacter sp. CS137]
MSNTEVRTRLEFMEFSQDQRTALNDVAPVVESLLGPALDRFYGIVRKTPETSRFFRNDAHMSGAKGAQQAHWKRIVSGRFDEDFYSSVRRIGSVHAAIGLEPRWYIGAYALVLEELLRGVARAKSPWRRLLGFFRGASATEASIAVVKAALLDVELSVSIYFEQAQRERNQAIDRLNDALASLAAGDMSEDLTGLPESFRRLTDNYNQALESLRGLIGTVTESTLAIRTGSGEIAQASEDLARRTESNAASLEQTSAAIAQMDQRLKASSDAARSTVARADGAIATVSGGRAVADEAMQAMSRVSESAKGIDSVIEGLDKIAFQTRVLAMNAAVEAGRAGEAGRGFAVVADLVSALAMRAEEEAGRARDQLTATQTDIVSAVDHVGRVDSALAQITDDVGEVHKLLGAMASDNQAQSSAIGEISTAITTMDQSTQQNAAMVEETSAAARNLSSEVTTLADQAAKFIVRAGPAARRGATAPRLPARTPQAPPAALLPPAATSIAAGEWASF